MVVSLEKLKFPPNVRNVWTWLCEWQGYVDGLFQGMAESSQQLLPAEARPLSAPGRSSTFRISVENSRVVFSLDQKKTVSVCKHI